MMIKAIHLLHLWKSWSNVKFPDYSNDVAVHQGPEKLTMFENNRNIPKLALITAPVVRCG